ncbi:dehydrodolichyl diphosphate synthase complex subunit Srt1p [Monosporozyma servazzii]
MIPNILWRYLEAPFVWVIQLIIEIISEIHFWIRLKEYLFIRLVFENSVVVKTTQYIKDILIYTLGVGPVPRHVSFIMDGNRRYARSQKVSLQKGHEAGGKTLLTLVYICKKIGVRCVSCYAFSIENFKRPKEEVDTLMELFAVKLDEFAARANDYRDPLYGSKLKIVGDATLLSKEIREKIKLVESFTGKGNLFTLYVCLPYTSRNDIHHSMCKSILKSLQSKDDDEFVLSAKTLSNEMYLENFSDKCDVVIRTSGHKRLSDYMLWQSHQNATIEFSDSLWPDFAFFEMYMMLLKWSFFQHLQDYKHSAFFLTRQIRSRCRLIVNKEVNVNYFDLPDPPISVSVTEKKG